MTEDNLKNRQLAESETKPKKPWEAAGMSRATWYRWGKPAQCLKMPTQKSIAAGIDTSLRQLQRMLRISKFEPELWERVVKGEISTGAAERQLAANQIAKLVDATRGIRQPDDEGEM